MRAGVRALAGATALAFIAGLVCQYVQSTDPRPPHVYFTVWSAALAAAVLGACSSTTRTPSPRLLTPAVTGNVVSAAVFAAVIAPATNGGAWFAPHDDTWVRAATALLHGLGPALAVATFAALPLQAGTARARWADAGAALWLPLTYLVAMTVLQAVGFGEVPYPFLNYQATAPLPLAGSVVALFVLFVLVAYGLLTLNHAVNLRRARRGTALRRSTSGAAG